MKTEPSHFSPEPHHHEAEQSIAESGNKDRKEVQEERHSEELEQIVQKGIPGEAEENS